MDPDGDLDRGVRAVAALEQPLRRDLYRLLTDRGGWISRDDAAAALDVARSVAAFHLDKLAEAGVVEVTFERTSGRTGPGAGRPSKLYRRRGDEVAASVPARHYDLAALLLARAVEQAADTDEPVAESLRTVARREGRSLGAERRRADADRGHRPSGEDLGDVTEVLRSCGYEPELAADGSLALRNCPFHRLAEQHRSLVCGMNLQLLGGVLEGMGVADELRADLRPEPGWCCVRITRP